MLEIMRSTPLRSVQSGLRPHNLHYVSIASACFSPARPAARCAWGFSRCAASAPHARAPLPGPALRLRLRAFGGAKQCFALIRLTHPGGAP